MCRYLIVVFETKDTDMNGCLEPTELRAAIDIVLQLTLNEDEFNFILSSMETNLDGSVTLKKFKKYFKSLKTIKRDINAGRTTAE